MKAVSDNFFRTRENYEREYAILTMKQKIKQLTNNYNSWFSPLESEQQEYNQDLMKNKENDKFQVTLSMEEKLEELMQME